MRRKQPQKRKSVYRLLIKYLSGEKSVLYGYVSLLLAAAAIELITPELYGKFVDEVLLHGNISVFFAIIAGYLTLFAIGALCSIGGRILLNRLTNTVEYRLRMAAISHILSSMGKRNEGAEYSIGDAKMRIDNDIRQISDFLRDQVGKYEIQILLTAGTGMMLLFINWKLALLGIIAVPVTLFLDNLISRKERGLNEGNRQNEVRMSTWLHMVVRGWKPIRMFQLGKKEKRKYINFLHVSALYNAKWINFWVTRCLIIPAVKNNFLMEFGVYFIGGMLILKNGMTVGDLLVFIVYYHMMTKSMTSLSAFHAQMKSDMHVYERVLEWEKAMEEEGRNEGGQIKGIESISLKNAGFQYDLEHPRLFSDIDLYVEKGNCVGIAGRSGCGKTTLFKVLSGLEQLKEGEIFINGMPLEQIDISSYHHKISGVMQGMHLFNASIRENLLYASPEAKEPELAAACQKAQIWEEIRELPEGLDTIAGEHGEGLSGGQCQRILLARAFLKEADIYFFDEVTSALDDRNAFLVYEEIQRLAKDKIVFMISHDRRFDRMCNKIITLSFSCKNREEKCGRLLYNNGSK